MAASVNQLLLISQLQVTENPGSQPAGVALASNFVDLNQFLQLSPTTSPPVSLFAVYKTTLAGGYAIDLTSAQGSNGTINASGKKLVAACVSNPASSAGNATVATGASTGYTLPASLVVRPGGFALVYLAAAGLTVDSSHRTLDVAGTDGDTPQIALVLG